MAQRYYLGPGCSDKLSAVLEDIGASRILVVHGKTSYQNCGAAKVIEALTSDKIEFCDFSENPKEEDVVKGLSLLNDGIDAIVAIGGGRVLDMAKLIRFFHSHEECENGYRSLRPAIPLVALPTTSGTGAEATRFAVMYRGKTKYSIDHPNVLPDVAIVDPVFTYDNPPYLSACTAFDALAQAIEAFWNKNATSESDTLALRALELIYPEILRIANNPGVETRDKISEGSYWAGRAINITRTTGPHAFSYPFTSYYGYPHGHAVALTFPQFAEINIPAMNNKKRELLKILGIEEDKIYSFFKQLILNIGLNPHQDVFINQNLIYKNINMQRLSNNPIPLNTELAKQILDRI